MSTDSHDDRSYVSLFPVIASEPPQTALDPRPYNTAYTNYHIDTLQPIKAAVHDEHTQSRSSVREHDESFDDFDLSLPSLNRIHGMGQTLRGGL